MELNLEEIEQRHERTKLIRAAFGGVMSKGIAMIAIIIVGALLGILAQSCGIVSPPAFWTIGAVTGLVAMGVGLCFR